ncbi:MAG: hypothetical protein PHO26_05925, partial [Dehalococcoidia bacterium]|nr:hypothetical protein [Dehalococcoidia bacterium]
TSRDGQQAVSSLSELLSERGVTLKTGNEERYYGHMHLLASTLSLLEKGPVSLKELFRTISVADAAQGNGLFIPKTAAGFFASQRYVSVVMNQASLKIADEIAKSAPEADVAVRKLGFMGMFKDYQISQHPDVWMAEFVKNYVLNGDELRADMKAWPNSEQKAMIQEAYTAIQKSFKNVEYGEKDLTEMAKAVQSMEKDAGALMADAERSIQSDIAKADIGDRTALKVAKDEEFEMRFGITRTDYEQMSRMPLGMRIAQLLTDDASLKANPIRESYASGLKLAGMGGAAATLGVFALAGAATIATVGVFALAANWSP